MPWRGITLGPLSGATLTHSARGPEGRRFFNTHRGSLINSTCCCTIIQYLYVRHVGQERNRWALRSWLVINCMTSSLWRLSFPGGHFELALHSGRALPDRVRPESCCWPVRTWQILIIDSLSIKTKYPQESRSINSWLKFESGRVSTSVS